MVKCRSAFAILFQAGKVSGESMQKKPAAAVPSSPPDMDCADPIPDGDEHIGRISALSPDVQMKVPSLLPVWFWPQSIPKKKLSKSYPVHSRCGARAQVLLGTAGSLGIGVTLEKNCSGTVVRKSFRVPLLEDNSACDECALLVKLREFGCSSDCLPENWTDQA